MHVAIIGRPKSGASTVAYEVANLLAHQRRGYLVPFATESTASSVWQPLGVPLDEVRRGRKLSSIQKAMAEAERGVFLLDTRTAAFAEALREVQEQSQRWKLETDLPRRAKMSPETWGVVNRALGRLNEHADSLEADLVEVHRQGDSYVNDSEYGRVVEGEGIRALGEAQATKGAHLVLVVYGGLRSGRDATSRSLRCVSDVSGRLVGEYRDLPVFRGRSGPASLRRLLNGFLKNPLKAIAAIADADRAAWKETIASEPPHIWEEAIELSARSEGELLADSIRTALLLNGLDGQDATTKKKRAKLLTGLFGVGHVDMLRAVSPEKLRFGLASLNEFLRSGREAAA